MGQLRVNSWVGACMLTFRCDQKFDYRERGGPMGRDMTERSGFGGPAGRGMTRMSGVACALWVCCWLPVGLLLASCGFDAGVLLASCWLCSLLVVGWMLDDFAGCWQLVGCWLCLGWLLAGSLLLSCCPDPHSHMRSRLSARDPATTDPLSLWADDMPFTKTHSL